MRRRSSVAALALVLHLVVGARFIAPSVAGQHVSGLDNSTINVVAAGNVLSDDRRGDSVNRPRGETNVGMVDGIQLAALAPFPQRQPMASSRPKVRLPARAIHRIAPTTTLFDISVADYRVILERALADLRAPSPDTLTIADDLRSVEPIIIPDGGSVLPDLEPIIADLTTDPPDTDAAIQRLEALLAALDRAEGAEVLDGAGDALRDVLARDEFTEEPVDDSPTWSERFWGWVWDVLRWMFGPVERLLDRLSGGSDGAGERSIFDIIVATLGVALIVGILFFAIRTIRRSAGPNVVGATAEKADRAMSSLAARADADRLAAEGNYRAALRARYLATLLRLEEAGRLRFDRSLTNREVLTYTVEHGDRALRDQLEPLVERFDSVWYGGATCSADDYARFAALADHVGDRMLATTTDAAA